MIISHIKLKNWRNFHEVDISLGQRVFLVGPNASGKSNFLDVFRFLRDIAKPGGGLQKAVSDRGGISKIRCLAARSDPQVVIEVSFSEGQEVLWNYSIGIKQETRGYRNPYLSYERVFGKGKKVILDRPEKKDKNDTLRLTQTYLEQINANFDFRDIADYFQSICYLHLIPQLLRHPEAFPGPGTKEDYFGRSFLEKLSKTPEKTRKARLGKIEKALKLAVPQFKELSFSRDEIGLPHLGVVYEHWRHKAGKQNEEQFSDGTLRFLALLWSLLESDSLLLLEEPELSLHAGIVRKLPGLIWRIQNEKKRQVIISTHSSELLFDKGIGGEEALLLMPDIEGTIIKKASSDKEIKELLERGFSIAEAALPRTEPKEIRQLSLFHE